MIVDEQAYAQQLRLQEEGGPRTFTILIGLFEALAIQHALDEAGERPLTHRLLLDAIGALGASLERVVIDDVERGPKGDTFFAKLVLDQGGRQLKIDCRPSDGIAVGVHAGVSFYVTEKVMDAVS
ncbi:MAG: bifunctional nuclease family protein [Planctomycetota bacterium]